MRLPNDVRAAKCSDRWMGLRSPVSCAKPTTSDDAMVFASVSVMPTERSSKYSVRSARIMTGADYHAGRRWSAGEIRFTGCSRGRQLLVLGIGALQRRPGGEPPHIGGKFRPLR